jgi:YesN/AraC family two-component response regulator
MKSTAVERESSVLIIDDEPLVRSFVRDALGPIVRVQEVVNGEAALEALAARPGAIDLVFADQVLPRRSALEVLQAIKRSWPWIPVVIITGYGSEHLAVQALRAGASDYLRKPIPLNTLLQTAARLLATAGPRGPSATVVAGVDGASAPRRTTHPSIRRALAFMAEHFAEAITLAEVARQAGVSRFHFCRLFHQEFGVPFHEHLQELRVCRAKTLLAERQLRISEIACTVGFNDVSHAIGWTGAANL